EYRDRVLRVQALLLRDLAAAGPPRGVWAGQAGPRVRGRDPRGRGPTDAVRPRDPPAALEDARVSGEGSEVRIDAPRGGHPVPASVHLRHGPRGRGPRPRDRAGPAGPLHDGPVCGGGTLRSV